ncbi:ASCH domain-containing protein [Pseudomonas protegens]|uniref:ASCH domain-containing protein n=1 Tax=Pseudomonas protegens TaxID=380021 RepID=UPI002751D9D1|nr:ASCH domain-containing protein [Pseudomonas protegens]MDP9528554.1 ASCH domain-containing protein [Pseudomonas protegens]
MKALSIRQPWAWLIIHGGKDIENRSWHTKYRGRFLVHAAKGMTRAEYCEALDLVHDIGSMELYHRFPSFETLERGGIIGSVELVDSVDHSKSPWYMGQKGFLLRDPKPLPFMPLKGQLQFFDVPGVQP